MPNTIGQSGPARSSASIGATPPPPRVRPAPQVIGRSIEWDAVVASVNRQHGLPVGPRPFAVYEFGGAKRRRIFTEQV
jgi:hypothetical protein